MKNTTKTLLSAVVLTAIIVPTATFASYGEMKNEKGEHNYSNMQMMDSEKSEHYEEMKAKMDNAPEEIKVLFDKRHSGEKLSEDERDEVRDYMKSQGFERGDKMGKKGHGDRDGEKGERGGKEGHGDRDGEMGHGNKGEHSMDGKILEDFDLQDLSENEKEILIYGYQEEALARDVYEYLGEKYGEEIFPKISKSEAKHMQAVKVLLDRYGMEVPAGYGELQETYDALVEKGDKSLKDALEVGLQIEILDIDDIQKAISETDNDDFKVIFTKIGGASYNHLRAFVKTLERNGLETDIDYSEYLSDENLETRGSIKYLLAEKLEKDGVDLPKIVSSDELKKKGGKKGHGKRGMMEKMKAKMDNAPEKIKVLFDKRHSGEKLSEDERDEVRDYMKSQGFERGDKMGKKGDKDGEKGERRGKGNKKFNSEKGSEESKVERKNGRIEMFENRIDSVDEIESLDTEEKESLIDRLQQMIERIKGSF